MAFAIFLRSVAMEYGFAWTSAPEFNYRIFTRRFPPLSLTPILNLENFSALKSVRKLPENGLMI
jgi:hypothetical protein